MPSNQSAFRIADSGDLTITEILAWSIARCVN